MNQHTRADSRWYYTVEEVDLDVLTKAGKQAGYERARQHTAAAIVTLVQIIVTHKLASFRHIESSLTTVTCKRRVMQEFL